MKTVNFVRGILCFVVITGAALKAAEKTGQYIFLGEPETIDRLCKACLSGNKNEVKKLLKENVDINGLNTKGIRSTEDSNFHYYAANSYTPLMCSAIANNFDIMKLLLAHDNIKVNQQNFVDLTALHFAVAKKDLQRCVQLLLKHRAEINIQNSCGSTPLHSSFWENVPFFNGKGCRCQYSKRRRLNTIVSYSNQTWTM